jgi:shikimate dehydrogenase
MSKPYAEVIGDPIAHSKSPLIHNFWLKKLGIEAEYRACHVRPDDLGEYFARRRNDPDWRGCNITSPHKVSVFEIADDFGPSVEDIGAANCIVPRDGRLIAFNTDTDGVFQAIGAGWPVCMIGAGGAARSVLPILDLWTSAWELRVLVRDPAKAAVELDPERTYPIEFFGFENAEQALSGAEEIINASPLGMSGQPPMPAAVLNALAKANKNARVFDMVYSPLETELLATARANGFEVADGLVMLVGQAKSAFEHFFGAKPDDGLDAELRTLLIA